ncbi:MAG: MBL fold metallo-hydrolase [Candidatus Omnitrophica bacterium]|nr:MBL fold metallo-hydrolase [Candidatus Omnitrophota bacterium]
MDKRLIVETVVVGQLRTNCYLLADSFSRKAVIIDPGAQSELIASVISTKKLIPVAIVLTHGHFDHIGAVSDFDLPVYIYGDEIKLLKNSQDNLQYDFGYSISPDCEIKVLGNNDQISVGDLILDVIHTPGHTPGGICLKVDGILFTGDTLFKQGVGRTDLPGGSYSQLVESLKNKIMIFDERTIIYPGHGPSSTIGREKHENGTV